MPPESKLFALIYHRVLLRGAVQTERASARSVHGACQELHVRKWTGTSRCIQSMEQMRALWTIPVKNTSPFSKTAPDPRIRAVVLWLMYTKLVAARVSSKAEISKWKATSQRIPSLWFTQGIVSVFGYSQSKWVDYSGWNTSCWQVCKLRKSH